MTRMLFNKSINVPHHMSFVVTNRDDKIKELKDEIIKLQDLRIENDVLKTKMFKMEK
jgi:hypothetical protein